MVTNRWNPLEAAQCHSLIEERVYSSRLLGQDSALVMHGGGNTSAKGEVFDVFGNSVSVLFIKGSGWDLKTIESQGFPALRMERLLPLRKLESLSDTLMMNELRTALIDSKSPDPSVESLLHAFLPHRFVDHTHADAILTLCNQPDGENKLRAIYGDRVAYVPYVMPGFQLAKACAAAFEQKTSVEGLILLNHGIFTFGDTAKESYEKMISLINEAERWLASKDLKTNFYPSPRFANSKSFWMHAIRQECYRRSFPCVLRLDESELALNYVNHPNVLSFTQQGPLTPDHVIRTKRLPLLLKQTEVEARSREELAKALDSYQKEYEDYFSRHATKKAEGLTQLDPLPRVFLLPGVGIITAGTTPKESEVVLDIYQHTASCILQAEQMSGYQALPEADIFDVEYWVLEQAKLKLGGKSLSLAGKIAVITGGVTGIGRAIAGKFLSAGAEVFILDINTKNLKEAQNTLSRSIKGGSSLHFLTVDVSCRDAVANAIQRIIETSGGIDILVLNAGIFPPPNSIESISLEDWDKSLKVNLDGSFHVVAEALKWMKESGQKPLKDIIFISSKNAIAPGKEAAAYSVAKAAQTQLARVCALEVAPYGVHVNILHPHLILDTPLWDEKLITERARAYGMSVDAYRTNNLLRTNLSSDDVAKAVLSLVSGSFQKSTGLQIPIDGGSDRTL